MVSDQVDSGHWGRLASPLVADQPKSWSSDSRAPFWTLFAVNDSWMYCSVTPHHLLDGAEACEKSHGTGDVRIFQPCRIRRAAGGACRDSPQ
jgi:hypothetical protein